MDFNRTYENRSQTEILETKVDGLNNRLQYLEHFIYLENKVKEQTELISKLSEQITYDKKQKNEESERQSNVISKLSGELKVMEAKKTPQETTEEVTQLKERVSLLEGLVLKTLQNIIMAGRNHDRDSAHKWNIQQYKEKCHYSLNRKFFVNITLTDSNKDWSINFGHSPQQPQICITSDYTTNSIRIYQFTSQWPHNTIGHLPFKTIGIDNKTKNYAFYLTLSPEEIEIKDRKARGDSFRFNLDVDNLHIWDYAYHGSNRIVEEIFE